MGNGDQRFYSKSNRGLLRWAGNGREQQIFAERAIVVGVTRGGIHLGETQRKSRRRILVTAAAVRLCGCSVACAAFRSVSVRNGQNTVAHEQSVQQDAEYAERRE